MSPVHGPDDDGLSLVELVICVVILGVLIAGITTVFLNVWKSQASVTDQTQATGRGQLISSQIEKAMRNAVAFDVRDSSGATSADGTGPTLFVATNLGGAKACQVFSFTGSNAQMSQLSGALGTGPWTKWEPGITQHKSSGGVLVPYFDEAGAAVSYSFDVTTPDGPTVTFSGTAYMRNPSGGSQSCF